MSKPVNIFTLSERLNEQAERLGLSLTALSEKSGLAKATITSLLQTPNRNPRSSTLNKVAKTLDVDPRYLVGEVDEPGTWADYARRDINTLQETRATYSAKEGRQLLEFEVGSFDIGFGAIAAARVLVDVNAPVRSGALYLVDLPDNGRSVCYFIEPYLMWMGSNGEMQHTVRSKDTEILGEIVTSNSIHQK